MACEFPVSVIAKLMLTAIRCLLYLPANAVSVRSGTAISRQPPSPSTATVCPSCSWTDVVKSTDACLCVVAK